MFHLHSKWLILGTAVLLSSCSLLIFTINSDLSKLDNSPISSWFREAHQHDNRHMTLARNSYHNNVKHKIIAHCQAETTAEQLEQCLQKLGMTCQNNVCQYSGTIGLYFYQSFQRSNDTWYPFSFTVNTVQGLQSFKIEHGKTVR